jgi:hypothetical protein
MADGISLLHGTLPASRKCVVHQKNGVMTANVTTAASQVPPVTFASRTPDEALARGHCTQCGDPDRQAVYVSHAAILLREGFFVDLLE